LLVSRIRPERRKTTTDTATATDTTTDTATVTDTTTDTLNTICGAVACGPAHVADAIEHELRTIFIDWSTMQQRQQVNSIHNRSGSSIYVVASASRGG
jgi:hypothetical protein